MNNRLIKGHITEIEYNLEKASHEKSFSAKQKKINMLKNSIESLRNELNIFEIDLCSATDRQVQIHKQNFESYSQKVIDLENSLIKLEIELKKRNKPQNELITPEIIQRNKPKNVFQMQKNELINDIDKKMEIADKDLNDIIHELNQGKDIMGEINLEIRRQQEVLGETHEKIKETYSLTKRSKKLINYFKRNIMTDKLMCVFLILIIVAVLVIIVLKSLGFKTDSFNP